MGLDRKVAARLAEERLDEWRRLGHHHWRGCSTSGNAATSPARDGRRYIVVRSGLDDGEGRVRIVVAVDDGGWPALAPTVRDEISRPDGSGTAGGSPDRRALPVGRAGGGSMWKRALNRS
ncbi:hypothetical protein AB0F73_05225 [Micromonospora purpureochromogenes]|uniref:hypothetical protein n=1 Tax=Micromonospora purpureochromogenes TaxID=47872 RepID=UPI0033DDD9FA